MTLPAHSNDSQDRHVKADSSSQFLETVDQTVLDRNQADLDRLLSLLPSRIQSKIRGFSSFDALVEIVLDLGAPVSVRTLDGRTESIGTAVISRSELKSITTKIASFNDGNRAGLDGTLHRISCIRNRQDVIVGLTLRVGRFVEGAADLLKDVFDQQKSVLILGAPGLGKTTIIREAARYLSMTAHRRVMVVDSSNEIGGEGDVPHPAIGLARRMQVKQPAFQYKVMVEAVQNHMPQVIIVDEIGIKDDAMAARTIAQRGVQLIATAHGFSLENVILNPVLSDLVGGVQTVILGDDEAKARGTQKVILERKNLPTFDVVVEMQSRDQLAIYFDVKEAVDQYLQDGVCQPEIRSRTGDGHSVIQTESDYFDLKSVPVLAQENTHVYPFGINHEWVELAASFLDIPIDVVSSPAESDLVLAYFSQPKQKDKLAKMTKGRSLPTHIIRQQTQDAVVKFFKTYFKLPSHSTDEDEEAMLEVKRMAKKALDEFKSIDLAPRSETVMAHQLAYVTQNGLNGAIIGDVPNRRVRIYAPFRSTR